MVEVHLLASNDTYRHEEADGLVAGTAGEEQVGALGYTTAREPVQPLTLLSSDECRGSKCSTIGGHSRWESILISRLAVKRDSRLLASHLGRAHLTHSFDQDP
jgi:hypothetical protein